MTVALTLRLVLGTLGHSAFRPDLALYRVRALRPLLYPGSRFGNQFSEAYADFGRDHASDD